MNKTEVKAVLTKNEKELEALDTNQLLLLAAAVIVLHLETLPPDLRLPLYRVLKRRSGFDLPRVLQA